MSPNLAPISELTLYTAKNQTLANTAPTNGTPVADEGNTGTGKMKNDSVDAQGVATETYAIGCIDISVPGAEIWSVYGSISGAHPNATTGILYTAAPLNFMIEDGSTNWALNDWWTVTTVGIPTIVVDLTDVPSTGPINDRAIIALEIVDSETTLESRVRFKFVNLAESANPWKHLAGDVPETNGLLLRDGHRHILIRALDTHLIVIGDTDTATLVIARVE